MALVRAWFAKRGLDPRTRRRIRQIEALTGFRMVEPVLYFRALRHRSKLAESNLKDHESYEQLEFLGDAVLDLIVGEMIFARYPDKDEGFMTQMRSRIVRAETLAELAERLGLHDAMEVGDRVRDQGIETSVNALSDVFEALIGALYRDRGFNAAFTFVDRVISREIDFRQMEDERDNFKSLLLEYAQARKLGAPSYRVARIEGPDHERNYTVEVVIANEVRGTGTGKSKKKAEQRAAEMAWQLLGNV